jgi:sec-independent protein translocase protein TatB
MFDMSWGEVMVIGAVALIVIGPKDLPKALRTLGNMTSKVRRMAAEFQSQFNDAMREAELDEIRKQVESVNQSVASLDTSFNPVESVRDELKTAVEAPVGAGTVPQAGADAASPSPAEAGSAAAGTNEPLPIPFDAPEPPPAQAGVAPAAEGTGGTRPAADGVKA